MARHGSAPAEHPSLVAVPGSGRGGGLATWPIRRKLTALVALPTLLVIGLIALLVSQSFLVWRQAARADVDASALIAANRVVTAANLELKSSLDVLLSGADAQAVAPQLTEQRTATDEAIVSLRSTLQEPPSGGWLPSTRERVDGVATVDELLPDVRALVDQNTVKQATLAQGYDVAFQPVRDLATALSTELGARTPNPRTVDATAVLSAIAATAGRASEEIVLLTNALHENTATLPEVNEIEEAASGQLALLELASSRADAAQQAKITEVRAFDAKLAAARANGLEIARNGSGTPSRQADQDALEFSDTASQRLALLDDLVASTSQDLKDQTSSDVRSALIRLVLLAGVGLVSLLLISLLVSSLARSITSPMRRLRSGAVDAATVRLPAAVRQIEREGPDAVVDVPPVLSHETRVGPETREVAQALDGLSGEAIRLATSQVRLRQSLDEAFVSMSRRSQAMVEKQLAIIDELESQEEDAEQLRNLFRLDHLAARMRRYNDNLLVLAGSAVRTRSAAPVAIADVFRAATSEMEQYERVRLQPLSGASTAGATAGGLIHLLAELLDNAAMYSPPTSPIVLSAAYSEDGGLRLEVTDSGVGIPQAEMDDLNARLAAPGTIDTQVPSRMGLYVVARLAQRGGLTVRLIGRGQAAGTVAEVIVPKSQVLGAPTGPLRTIPDTMITPTEPAPPRLPAQPGSPDTGRGTRPIPLPQDSVPAPMANPAPTGDLAPTEAPEIRPAHAPSPSISGTGEGAKLPSRRPGAALQGGPLAEGAPVQPPAENAGPGSALTSTPPWEQKPAAAADLQSPETGAPQGLPRRSPGRTHRDATPFESTPSARRPDGPGTFEAPRTFEAPSTFEAPPRRDGTPGSFTTGAPGHRPGARPLPVRAPGQPGGGPPVGPSATAAVAAAAAARPRPSVSGAGLFAPTGPSLDPGQGKQADRAETTDDEPAAAEPTAQTPADEPPAQPPADEPSTQTPADEPSTQALADEPSTQTPAEESATQAPVAENAGSMGDLTAGQMARKSAEMRSGTSDAPQTFERDEPDGETSMFENEAREAARSRHDPAGSGAPTMGAAGGGPGRDTTPIFDSISVWFSDDSTQGQTQAGTPAQVIDLREPERPSARPTPPAPSVPNGGAGAPVSRWASLGDQRWIAANARAAAGPQTAGNTTTGLPKRRPGANLLPSATAAAGTPTAAVGPPARQTDAESVRGRLGSYQRGLASARKARHLPDEGGSRGQFGTNEAGDPVGRQGGES